MKIIILMLSFVFILSGNVHAACSFSNSVPLKSLTAGFQAWKSVTGAMAECGNLEAELDQDFRLKQPDAFAANRSLEIVGESIIAVPDSVLNILSPTISSPSPA